jgi:glycosyltransferase involved in cell wall biosynthesis
LLQGRRVLVLCLDRGIPLYGPAGGSAHLRGVIRGLAAHGLEVTAAVSRLGDARGWRLEPVPARVTVVRTDRPLKRQLGRVDWIWERLSLDAAAGPALALAWQVPRLLEVNAPVVEERLSQAGLRDPARARDREQANVAAADRVAVVSSWLERWARGLGAKSVRVVRNGTGASRPGDREGTRRRLGVDGLVLGFVGSGRRWHGISSFPGILGELPEATLLVVGADAPPHPRIIALGSASEAVLPDLLAACDVGLAPHPVDAPAWFCPLKILDYRAQGLPVVATRLGEAEALIGIHGRVLTTDRPEAWAKAIRSAAALPRTPEPRTWADAVSEAITG